MSYVWLYSSLLNKAVTVVSLLLHAGPLNPWAWGDPFEDAEGRPETKHSHLVPKFYRVVKGGGFQGEGVP